MKLKKLFSLSLIFILVFLVGCTTDSIEPPVERIDFDIEISVEKDTFYVGDNIIVDVTTSDPNCFNNVYLEINVGGLFKVTSNNEVMGEFAYPRDEFWKIVSEYPNVKVIIGVDAHKPEQLRAKEILMAYEFAKKHNIKVEETVETIG